MTHRRHLIPVLEGLDTAVVGCVGDVMLDRFVTGNVSRISPEAPIPVLHIESQQSMLGGAGNSIRNLGALGCGIRLFSITGEDPAGAEVEALVQEIPNCQAWLVREGSRLTPVKTRYAAHGQQLLRADRETAETAAPDVVQSLLVHFRAHLAECSVVLLSDYAKGVLKGFHAQRFIQLARTAGKPVVVDPKGADFERYRMATVIKPNLKELAEATRMPVGDTDSQESAARKLLDLTDAQFILVTRGPAGMLLVPREEARVEFVSVAREVYDVSGAGDTVAAVLAAAIGSGAGMREAAELANIAGGIVVGKSGTAVADRSEMIHEIERDPTISASGKILRATEALERQRVWRRMGRRVGFVFGAFHPLSSEHLELLERARSQCDQLIVGLQAGSGSSGNLQERALLLASLLHVDAVVVCDAQSPQELAQALEPSVVMEAAPARQKPAVEDETLFAPGTR